MIENLDQLLQAAGEMHPQRALVVLPVNDETFAAIRAGQQKLRLTFLLAGDRQTIERELIDLAGIEVLECRDTAEFLNHAPALFDRSDAGILLKGSIDTATLIKAALRPESGLRTGRVLSDVFVFEYHGRRGTKLVMITDGGLNIAPDLGTKAQMIGNAVEVAHALGNLNPKVAVLAATEFVQANMVATTDAAILSKMNERGQIRGCVVEGPLALDSALDEDAAGEKHLAGPVAGRADILLCPNIECANAVAKSTTYIGGSRLAHVVVGARIPILIPSRADSSDAKLMSLALGMIMSEYSRGSQ